MSKRRQAPTDDRLTETIAVRVDAVAHALVAVRAAKLGLTPGGWLRRLVLRDLAKTT